MYSSVQYWHILFFVTIISWRPRCSHRQRRASPHWRSRDHLPAICWPGQFYIEVIICCKRKPPPQPTSLPWPILSTRPSPPRLRIEICVSSVRSSVRHFVQDNLIFSQPNILLALGYNHQELQSTFFSHSVPLQSRRISTIVSMQIRTMQ